MSEEEPDLIIHEIGERGNPRPNDSMDAARGFLGGLARYPNAERAIMLDGYDDDPREIWEIPEAKRQVLDFVANLYALAPELQPKDWKLDDVSNGLVMMCLDMARAVRTKTGWNIEMNERKQEK